MDRYHSLWPIYSIDVIEEGKRKGRGKVTPRKKVVYRVFPDVIRIGKPKAVTYIPILQGHNSYEVDSFINPHQHQHQIFI